MEQESFVYVYKIRRKFDGRFSSGGSDVRWTTKGKAWGGLGQLKNHLNLFVDYKGILQNWPYYDCEVVRYQMVVSEHVMKLDIFKNFIREKQTKYELEQEKDKLKEQRKQDALNKLTEEEKKLLGVRKW